MQFGFCVCVWGGAVSSLERWRLVFNFMRTTTYVYSVKSMIGAWRRLLQIVLLEYNPVYVCIVELADQQFYLISKI